MPKNCQGIAKELPKNCQGIAKELPKKNFQGISKFSEHTMSYPDMYNNIFDDETTLSVAIKEDNRGQFVPTITNATFPQRGFQSFELGTMFSLRSWLQGDKHASWSSVPERCSLNVVIGYCDDDLKQHIPTIEADGTRALQTLLRLEEEALKLAFVDHRVQCEHKAGCKTVQDYISGANSLQKGVRHVEDTEYPMFHMSTVNTGPETIMMWKCHDGVYVRDDMFAFDEKPPHQHPLNYLPGGSIIIPRVRFMFYTSEQRYGIKLQLERDIRVVRPGRIEQVYAEHVYLETPTKKRKRTP